MPQFEQNQTLLGQIDQALSYRNELVEALEMIRSAPESGGFRSEIDSFIHTLRSEADAKELVSDGRMAIWLPAILGFRDLPDDDISRWSFLANEIQRCSEVRTVRTRSWTYLGCLVLTFLSVFLGMCAYVIPEFDNLFKEFQLGLPLPTKIVLKIGAWIGPNATAIMMSVVGTVCMFWISRRIRARLGREYFSQRDWWFFSWGQTNRVMAMSRLACTLACLLRVGAPLREALMIAGRSSQSEYYVQRAVRLATESETVPIRQCASSRAFPALMISAIDANGIAQGNTAVSSAILNELGLIYAERARYRSEYLAEFLLPLSIMLIGGCVALIVLALFMPLISLITSLSGGA